MEMVDNDRKPVQLDLDAYKMLDNFKQQNRLSSMSEAVKYAVMKGSPNGEIDYMALSVLGTDGVLTVDAESPGTVTIDDLEKLLYALPAEYRAGAALFVNCRTDLAIRMFKKTNPYAREGEPESEHVWKSGPEDGRPTAFGYPVYVTDVLDDIPAPNESAVIALLGNPEYFIFKKYKKAGELEVPNAFRKLEIKQVDAKTKAFYDYFVNGKIDSKNLIIGGPDPEVDEENSGFALVPDEIEKKIRRAVAAKSLIRQLVSVRTICSDRIRIRSLDEATVGWNKIDVSDTTQRLIPSEDYQYVEDIKKFVQSTKPGVLDPEQVGKSLVDSEDALFIIGWGHKAEEPEGILNSKCNVVAAKSDGTITAYDALDVVYAVPIQYRPNASWLVNPKTEEILKTLIDGKGQHLWEESKTAGKPNTFMGYPIYTHEAMPIISSDSDAKVAIFGDLKSGYRIVDHTGMRMKRHDNGAVMVHERIGGSIVRPDAIRILKVSPDEHAQESHRNANKEVIDDLSNRLIGLYGEISKHPIN